MNPNLDLLQPYPFIKLQQLKKNITPPEQLAHIALSIGEPQQATPHFIQETLLTHLHRLSQYPNSKGLTELRQAIADWLAQRFQISHEYLDPETQVLPVSGTREALFSFAQCVLDASRSPLVVIPNPFYQIYEGAALLAGAEPYFINCLAENNYLPDFQQVPEAVWQRCQLLYICSPGNPTGAVISQQDHLYLMELAERYDFVIAADECYSEIYADEEHPPQGLLQSAFASGNTAFKRCIVFHSLSKRSNAPGLRSGFVAGDSEILERYLLYRTYHGCAMPLPSQHASIAAWQDETHVQQNRQFYRERFAAVANILSPLCDITIPPASFYLWLQTPISDAEFAQKLFQHQHITVLPGSYLSRTSADINPGENHVRIALVAPLAECIDAAHRIENFIKTI